MRFKSQRKYLSNKMLLMFLMMMMAMMMVVQWTCMKDTVQASWRPRRLSCRSAQSTGCEAAKTQTLKKINIEREKEVIFG